MTDTASPAAPAVRSPPRSEPDRASDPAALEAAATAQNQLAEFFRRERRRASRRLGLPLALLSAHGARYLFRRGSVLFARVPLRTALHLAEVVVFADFLDLGLFGWLLALRSAVVVFGAFHFGALEPMRRSVRQEVLRGDAQAAELETARYLRIGIDLCILQLFALIAWTKLGPRPFASFSILDAYAIGCALRSMTETITRTYHAGAFALRRVYRPFLALLAVDVVDAGTALVLWPWLGPWGFALAQIAGGAVEAWLTLRYVRRTYAKLPVSAPTLRRVLSDRARAPLGTVRAMLAPGFGNLVAQVDALLITVLALGTSRSGVGLAAGLHVLRPVLSLGSSWARLFYFDLAALDGPVRRMFRLRFERLLVRTAPWFAFASIGTGALLGQLLGQRLPVAGLFWFLPFLVVRSVFAVAQLRAFVRGAYGALVAGAAVVSAAVVVAPRLHAHGGLLLAVACCALALAAAVFWLLPGVSARDAADEPERLSPPLPFLGRLAALTAPSRPYVLALEPGAGAHGASVARVLAALPGVHLLTRLGRRTLVLVAHEAGLSNPELVAASGGTLAAVDALPRAPDGRAALDALLAGGHLDTTLDRAEARDARGLRELFLRRFPGGIVLDDRAGNLPRAAATPRELALTLGELASLAGGVRPARRRGLRATVFAPCGEATLVFVAPPATNATEFARFEELALTSSICASLEPARIGGTAPAALDSAVPASRLGR